MGSVVSEGGVVAVGEVIGLGKDFAFLGTKAPVKKFLLSNLILPTSQDIV